jgi:hypothetical protein
MKELSMNDNGHYIWLDAIVDDGEIPAWKALDIVCRKWATLTGFENDQEKYAELRAEFK